MIVRTGLPRPYCRLLGETEEDAAIRVSEQARAHASLEATRMAGATTTVRMILHLLMSLLVHGNRRLACTSYQRLEPVGEVYRDGEFLVIGGS